MMSSNESVVSLNFIDDHGIGILLYIVVMSTILVFSVVSNILVIYCVARFKKLRTVTNIFICNLSVSDILLAGFVMPQRIHDITHQVEFHEGDLLCKVINFCPVLLISSSIYTLVTVSFERHNVIIDSGGKGQANRMSNRKILAAIVCIWASAIAVSVPSFLEYSVQKLKITERNNTRYIRSCSSQFSKELSLANAILVMLMSYIIPVVLLTRNYSQLTIFMWRKLKKIKQNLQRGGRNVKHVRLFMQRTRVIKLLVLVAVFFAVSWCPYFTILLYAKVTGNDESNHAAGFVNLLLLAFTTFSAAYNVVLYVIFNPSYKHAIVSVLKCANMREMDDRVNSVHSHVSPVESGGTLSGTADIGHNIAVITTQTSSLDGTQ